MSCISSICAVDNNEYKTNSSFFSDGEIGGVDEPITDSHGKLGVCDSDCEILKSSVNFTGTNFTALQEEIDNCHDGDIIYLKNDVIQDGDSPITISKSITIIGNGYTIDANNQSNIFYIEEKVNLSDITFVNGYATNGGAIYNYDGRVTISGCNFINNSAGAEGGAIFNSIDDGLFLTNSYFINNSAKLYGGAICTRGWSEIYYVSFSNNSAESGGAIFNRASKMNAQNIIFSNNYASGAGGAIYNSAAGNIQMGYAIFTNNSAVKFGGAIYNVGNSQFAMANTNFIKNTADYGGAIYNAAILELRFFTVANNTFSQNTASSLGGAVYNGNEGILYFRGCNLTQNSGIGGESIYNLGDLKLGENKDSNFIYNARNINSAIYATLIDGENVFVYTLDEMLYPFAALTDDNGNPIWDSNFKICVNNTEIRTTFHKDTKLYVASFPPSQYGEYEVNTHYTSSELNIKSGKYIISKKGSFTELKNLIDCSDGILNLTYNFTYDLECDGNKFPGGVIIDKPIIINGNGYAISGNNLNRIFNISSDVVFNNVTFINGNASNLAGAIYIVNGHMTLTNCSFINNSAESAGAIYFDSDNELIIINSTFVKNKASGDFTYGGAIYINRGNLLMNDSRFIENEGYSGAAVYNLGVMTITNCNFTNNTCGYGAIYNNNSYDSLIQKSTFAYNYGVLTNAIYNYQGSLLIDDSQFTGNFGRNSSGTVNNNEFANITISNSIFTNNSAGFGGGVYSYRNAETSIINSTFIDNKGGNGEAVYSLGNLYLKNNYFSDIIYINQSVIRPDITSEVYLNLVNGSTCIEYLGKTFYPFATLTDDNGNAIYDERLSICINGEKFNTTFNSTTKTYYTTFTPATYGEYDVDPSDDYLYSNLTIDYGTYYIVKKGSLYELNALIQTCDDVLELPYNFTYDSESDWLLNGVILIKNDISIEGNGYAIDGKNINSMFDTFSPSVYDKLNLKLNNISFINGNSGMSIISLYGTNLEINNCKFKSNFVSNGGIVGIFSDSVAKINNCQFMDNLLEFTSGVIFNSLGEVIINNSLFKDNIVPNDCGIIYNLAQMSIFNSNITNPIDKHYNSIYNKNTLFLENNNLSDVIYNKGDIVSGVNAELINGKNITVYLGETVYPFAKLTDSDGNVIHDESFEIYLNNVKFETEFNIASGLYNTTFNAADCGDYIVSTRYSLSNLTLTTGQYFVVKKGSYSDLRALIYSSDEILELDHDFYYYSQYDGDKFPEGIVIDKDITINANNHSVSGIGSHPIFYISGGNVSFNNIILLNSSSDLGAAIYNMANLTITGSQFMDNHGKYGGAIYNYGNLTLINSTFIRNDGLRNDSILNLGTLYLENNSVSNFIYSSKVISSRVNVELIDGKTIYKYLNQTDYPFARMTDDNGNLIVDLTFKICLNDIQLATEFNPITRLYNATFKFDSPAKYDVNFTSVSDNFTVTPGVYIAIKQGSYSDLEALILTNDVLDLGYDFSYDLECDGDKFPEGIVISKNIAIEGNGYTIDGNNSYRIFYIDGGNVTLNNINFINGAAEFGGAICNNGNLTITDSNFINNTAVSNDSIYNLKTLFLRNNNVSNIIYNLGNITSMVYAEFIEGKTVYAYLDETIYPSARLSDENGNIINDVNFNIYLNDVKYETYFNKTAKLYNTTFTPVNSGNYSVRTENRVNLSINSGLYVALKKGSYTDLQNLIDRSSKKVLNLEYDFSYDLECDGDKFPEGVVIDKIIYINGQGHVLSGNNSYRLFSINAADVFLFNMTLVNGTADNGGAIVNEGNLTIADTNFIQNSAKNLGGAIYNYNGDIVLSGDFIENSASKNGGAIYNIGGNIGMGHSLFEKNTAKIFGGAIYNGLGEIIINASQFENNVALAMGDGIYNNLGDLKLTNSVFTQNDRLDNVEIYNGGLLSLENNTISNIVYNVNSINSTVKAILINGENITGYLNESNNLFATLTDDYGNAIHDIEFVISVNGSEVETTYNPATRLYTATFTPADCGDYIINTPYESDKLIISPGKYAIVEREKLTPTISIEVTPIELGDSLVVIVKADGEAIANASGKLNVTIEGLDSFILNVSDGRAIINPIALPKWPGNYIANLNYSGDKYYSETIEDVEFTINKVSNVEIIVPSNVTIGNVLIINVTDAMDGILNVTIADSEEFSVDVENGFAYIPQFMIPQSSGLYDISVKYFNGSYFADKELDTTFHADKITDYIFDISYDTILFGENASISIDLPADVNVNDFVVLINQQPYTVNITDGYAILENITDLPVGKNDVEARFESDKYETSYAFSIIEVDPNHISFDIIVPSEQLHIGDDASITVQANVSLNAPVTVYINGRAVNKNLTDGVCELTISPLLYHEYLIAVAFEGNENYTACLSETVSFNVDDAILENTTIDADIKTFENNVTITVNVNPNATGFIQFDVSGAQNFTVYLALDDGKAIWDYVLAVGDYNVLITYLGDSNFNINSTTAEFSIVGHIKKDTEIIAIPSVDSRTVTISVGVDENATGFATVGVLGQVFIIPVNEGKAVFVYDFFPGTYSANVIYLGDDNFNNASSEVSFTVVQENVTLKNTTITVDVDSVENNVTITVAVDTLASGLVEFNIGGKAVYIPVNNGEAVYNVVLATGDYNVDVTYLGDDKFNPNKTSQEFTVVGHVKRNTTITSDVLVDGYNVTIDVNVDLEATGFVELSMNGESIFTQIKNGKAVYNGYFKPGNYTITAAYLGDENFNPNATDINVIVDEIPLKNTTIDADVLIIENYVIITVNVNENATGFVEFDVSGVENYTVYVAVVGGKAILDDVLASGDYKAVITYLGDDNFNMNTTTEEFTVVGHIKRDTEIKAVPSVDSSTVTIKVTVDKDATGYVAIGVLGQNFIVPVNDGEAVFVYDFFPGTYSANVVYLGDDNFNNASTTASFTVIEHKTELKNTTISVDIDAVENNVTLTAVVNSLASGLVEFNIDDKSVYIVVNNGVAVYNEILPAGDYNAIVTYLGDNKFNSNSTSKEFSVVGHVKKNTTITSDVIVDGFNVTLIVDLNPDVTGFVEFILAENSIFAQVNNGKAVFNGYVLPGNYTVDAIYLGDDDFNTNATVINFKVDDIPLKNTTINSDVVIIENNVTITVNVDKDATGFIKFDVSGAENYTVYVDVADGKAILEDILTAGDYKAVITYLGDDNFNMNTTTEEFCVVGHIKKDTEIKAVPNVESSTVTITVNVDRDASGYVAIGVLGQNFIVAVKDGEAVFVYDFFPGTYSANVVYLGDDNFNNASTTVSFTVTEEIIDLKNTTITVDVNAVENNVTIVSTIDALASGLIEFNIGGKAVYLPVNNGVAVYNTILPAGDYNAVVTYLGDDKFNSNSTSKEFTVTDHVKLNTTISLDVLVDGYKVTITVGIDFNATGFIEFNIAGRQYYTSVNSGKGVLVADFPAGRYIGNLHYLGDDNFNDAISLIYFVVEEPLIVPITSEFTDIVINDDLNISMVLNDGNGNPISNASIRYSVNGVSNTTATLTDGSFVIKGENGAVIKVVYDGNETIKGTNITLTLTPVVPTVVKVTHFDIPGGLITIKGYAVDTKAGEKGIAYSTTLLDEDGKSVVGVPIRFALNDKVYYRTTNEKGSFDPYHLNMRKAQKYTIAFYFAGDDNYTNTFASVCADLAKKPIKIKASAKFYKASAKTKSYTVTLSTIVGSSDDGKAHLSPKKVTLKVNGKTYTGKTNSKGQVTFKITNLSKKGVYTAKISYAGDITYESATKSVKLTVI